MLYGTIAADMRTVGSPAPMDMAGAISFLRRWSQVPAWRCLMVNLAVVALLVNPWPVPPTRVASVPPPFGAALSGKIVLAELSGFEPDFDPINRVVIAATLRDLDRPARALPDTMVVLSAYLENFTPDTTPVLPDLLHPEQTASALGGFMQGKAALVNRAGQTSYRGSLLAEVFLDNSVHLVLDLQRCGAAATAPSLRLKGIFTLHKDLTLRGELHAERPLSPVERDVLRAPPRRLPSWQAVVQSLSVRPPPMVGTAGTRRGMPAQRHGAQQPGAAPVVMMALGGTLVTAIGITALLWRHRAAARARQVRLSQRDS